MKFFEILLEETNNSLKIFFFVENRKINDRSFLDSQKD